MSDTIVDPSANETPGDLSTIPAWARDAISKANQQAAERRVEIRTLTDKLAEAQNQGSTLSDDKAAAEKARDAANHELLKLRVAIGSGVPGEQAEAFAGLLNGATEDELKTHAESVMQMFGGSVNQYPRGFDPSAGRGGDSSSAPANTPQAEFAQLMFQHWGVQPDQNNQ